MIRHSILISHTRFPFQEFHPVGNEVWNPTGEGGGAKKMSELFEQQK